MLEFPLSRALIELLAIILLLALNGLFALSEIAVVSANKARLQQLAEGDARALRVLDLADEPTTFLSTVQIGITLVGILAGALSGATLSIELATLLAYWDWLSPYTEIISFTAIVILVTFLSLLIGELIPKSIALSNPERFAIVVAPFMQRLAYVSAPIVLILSAITERMLRVLHIPQNSQPPVTEEEIKVLLAEGAAAGVFEPLEQQIVTQALELDDISLRSIITHRTFAKWIDLSDSAETVHQKIVMHNFTAFPLCDGSMDQVVGVVLARDVLLALEDASFRSTPVDLTAIAQKAIVVPLTSAPSSLLQHFRDPQTRVIFAADEYGGVEGMVTQTDILTTLTARSQTLLEH
ncbi:hemolysin family protein [Chloroflexi bacterium TSY]|nr:hemolysin family protein [Chloroflexi bacterium TSY]